MTATETYRGYYFTIGKQGFFALTDRIYKTRSLYQQVLRYILELNDVKGIAAYLEDQRLLDEIRYYLDGATQATITVLEDHYKITSPNVSGGWSFDEVQVLSLDR